MAQYGFCGGAAKPANTFYLFWQWARPEGCGILCSPAPRRAGRTLLVPRGARQTAPAGTRKAAGAAPARSTLFPELGAVATAPNIGAVVSRAGWGCTRARQSAAGGEGDGHLGAKTRIPDPKGGIKLLEGLGCSPRARAPGSSSPNKPPAPLPLRWFNMRESKCTIQNLKTGLWGAARPPRAPKGAQTKGKGDAQPRGEAGRGWTRGVHRCPPPGRLLRHTQHDALAQLSRRLSLEGGLEGPQPGSAEPGPRARSLLLLVSCCGLLFGGPRHLLGGRALLVAGDRGTRGVQLAGGSPALGTSTC